MQLHAGLAGSAIQLFAQQLVGGDSATDTEARQAGLPDGQHGLADQAIDHGLLKAGGQIGHLLCAAGSGTAKSHFPIPVMV